MKKRPTPQRRSFLDTPAPAAQAAATSSKRKLTQAGSRDLFDVMEGPQAFAGQRVTLHINDLEPDPSQARWLLPPDIRSKFIAGKIDASQALAQWRKHAEAVREEVTKAGRDPEKVGDVAWLSEIETLAKSIHSGGQVNPITVARIEDRWRIETGERRYWAHVWLVSVVGDKSAAQVPAIQQATLDPFRQAVENRHTSPLNAVSMARDIARLIITSRDSAPGQKSRVLAFADYRAVAQDRLPSSLTERIAAAMGMSPDYLGRYRRLLALPDEALLIADRNDLTEKQLRHVTELESPKWQTRVVRGIAEMGLSHGDVEWWCRQPDLAAAERELRSRMAGKDRGKKPGAKAPTDPNLALYTRWRGFEDYALKLEPDSGTVKTLAQRYVAERGEEAAGRLQRLIGLLQDVVTEIETRNAQPGA